MSGQPQYLEIQEWEEECGYCEDIKAIFLYVTCSNQILTKMKVSIIESENKLKVEEEWNTSKLLLTSELYAEYGLYYERFNQEFNCPILYVCDSKRRRIVQLNCLDGSLQGQLFLKRKEKFSSAVSIVIDSKKKWIIVSEMAGQRVKIIDYKTRQLLHTIGKYGQDLQSFSYPRGIFLEEKMRRLFVCDASNNRISIIDLEKFEIIKSMGGKLSNIQGPQLKTPTSVVVDEMNGNMFISDNKLDQVFILQ